MLKSVIAHWTTAVSGLFTTAARWSTDLVPDSNTEAFLDATGHKFTVTSAQDEMVAFLALSSNATFDDETGVFAIGNAADNAGTIDVDGSATLALGSAMNGPSQLVNSGVVNIASSTGPAELEFNAPQTQIQGGGAIVLSGNAEITGGSSGNNADLENIDNTIFGSGTIGGQFLRFQNDVGGTVDANRAVAMTLDAEGGANGLSNFQTIGAQFIGSMLNVGTIETTGAGGLNIDSSMVQNGYLIAGGTGALTINRATVSGSGTDSTVAKGSSIVLSNGRLVTSGVISTVAHSLIKTKAGTTDSIYASDVENAGDIVVTDGSTLFLAGQVNNSGAIDLDGATAATRLVVRGAPIASKAANTLLAAKEPPRPEAELDLQGAGTLTLSDSVDNFIRSNKALELLVNSSAIVGSGTIGDRDLIFDNAVGGVVDSDGNAGMNIIGDRFKRDMLDNNSGLIETTGTGGLTLSRRLVNSGILKAAGSGALTLDDAIVKNAGGIVETTHAGASIVLRQSTIEGGEISIAAGSALDTGLKTPDTLSGTVLNEGTINIGADSTLFAAGHWTNAGVINVNEATGGSLMFESPNGQAFELDGGGTINLGGGQFSPGSFDVNSSTMVIENVNNKIVGSGVIGDSNGFLILQNDVGGFIDATGSGGLSIWSGNDIDNAGTIQSDSSGGLTINGVNGSNFDNGGHLIANVGNIDVDANAQGPGVAEINNSASIEFAMSSDLDVLFGKGAAGLLTLDTSTGNGAYTGEISGFTSKDEIDLSDIAFSSTPAFTYNGDAFGGTLTVGNGTLSTSLHMVGDYTQSSFTLTADKNGNTLVS